MVRPSCRIALLFACVLAPAAFADERSRPGEACVAGAPACSVAVVATGEGGAVACLGDCGDDGAVTVDELVLLVGMALGDVPLAACPPISAVPGVADLVLAVGHALSGCPSASPTPTPTRLVDVDDGLLLPQRVLRIAFTTHPPFVESLPNTLYALLGDVERQAPFGAISGALYDGEALLGVSTSTNGCCATGVYSFDPVPVTWRSPDSPWDFPAGDPAAVDFTALHDGSIDGRIDITIDAGRIALDPDIVALVFVHATSSNGGSTIPPAPRLRSVRLLAVGDPSAPTPTAVLTPPPSATPTVETDDD